MKEKPTITFLDRKAIPTWRVKQGESEWFFTENNGSIFDPPQKRAQRLFDKLMIEYEKDKK